MASIDERVVAMSFENARFEAGVAQTMATLNKLNATLAQVGQTSGLDKIEAQANKVTLQGPMSALDKLKSKLGLAGDTKGFADIEKASEKVSLSGPMSALDKLRSRLGFIGDTKGFSDIEKASEKVSFSTMGSAIDGVQAKFTALQVAGAAALGTLVSQITAKTSQLAKALSLGPITDGLNEYATNLNSIQTILANTQASGAGLKDVNSALNQLNLYSDKTIYNFSQMAKNIGTFTAAGVDLKTATASIKGIANLAALSGSNSEQAATAMYQLSQAISAGRVSLQDWNSVVNAGMGGTVFQRALATTAQRMGTLHDGSVKLSGAMKNVSINGESFRESITARPGEKSWLTSEVLTNTLQQFTGDLSDAQLKAQGFTDQEIKSIQQTAKTAQAAATEVKTLSGVWDVAKESMGSGWAATWQIIFGDFTEAKKTFTGLSQALSNLIGNSAKARNAVLGDWKELGGRAVLIEGIKNIFHALGEAVGAIKAAFRDIFPAKTGKDLFEMTQRFRDFTEHLKASPETLDNLRRTFRGLFAALSIGFYIVKKVIGVIFDLLGIASHGRGEFLNFTGSIGDFLTALQKTIVKGDALGGVFNSLAAVLRIPLEILKALASAFFGLFDGMDSKKTAGASKSIDGVSESLRPLKRILDGIANAWHEWSDFIQNIKVPPWVQQLVDQVKNLGKTVADAISNTDFNSLFAAIQTTLLGGLFLTIKKALGKGIGIDVGGGMLKNLSDMFGALTGNLKALQQNVQAGTLLKIAAAIGVLAAGVALLSTIDPKRLASAMTAVAVGLGQLVAAMAILSKVTGGASFLTMPLIAASLVELATAVTILAGAMKIFATMSWEELIKGLVGVGGALVGVGVGLKIISGPQILAAGPGLLAVAIAMNVLAVAMKIFASFKWEELAKGIVGIAGSLLALGVGLEAVGPSTLLVGPGLIAAAIGLTLLSGAIRSFGSMKLGDMAKGIVGIAAALLTIGVAISAIPPTVALQAAGLVVLAVALTGIAGAIKIFGSMDVGQLIKGLIGLGGALVVLGVGLTAMSGTLAGAVALTAAAGALALLAPTLAFLGTLNWGTILKGLAAIALTLGTLAAVGLVASEGIVALGIALIPFGLAVAAAGAGVYLLAKGFALLGESGSKGLAAMIATLTAFIALLPTMIINFLKGLVQIVAEIAKLAPTIVDSMVRIVNSLVQVVIDTSPKLAEAAGALILAFVKVLDDNAGPLIDAGWRLLLHFLTGVANNVGKVTEQVTNIIVNFLNAMVGNAPKLVASGVHALAAWLLGITNHIPQLVATVAKLIVTFVNSVAAHIGEIIAAGSNLGVRFVLGVAGHVARMAKTAVDMVVAFLGTLGDQIPRIINAGVNLAGKFLHAVANGMVRLANVGADAVIDFLNGIARVIREKGPALRAAGINIATALMEGFMDGLDQLWDKVKDKLLDIAHKIPSPIRKALKILSPSRVFMDIGKQTMLGLALGIEQNAHAADGSLQASAKDLVDTASSTLSKVPDILSGLTDMDPVITPILDLTNVKKDAKQLQDLTNVVPITAAASFDHAKAVSDQQQAADAAAAAVAPVAPVISLEQNNYSPEALSEIEIYRQTNNQLSQLKGVVGLTP